MDHSKIELELARYQFLNSLPLIVRVARDLNPQFIDVEALADAAHDTVLMILQAPR